ncbi:MAG: FAD-dependent oxidoreductase, partial [Sulfuricaulis sp.]|nr:FAD-dependent oxidoreductase [Sulfuricaulis sp.]
MNRRNFIYRASATATTVFSGASLLLPQSARATQEREVNRQGRKGLSADVVIAGGGLGGCAAALAALRNNLRVIMTEETDWIGGQLTQQGV